MKSVQFLQLDLVPSSRCLKAVVRCQQEKWSLMYFVATESAILKALRPANPVRLKLPTSRWRSRSLSMFCSLFKCQSRKCHEMLDEFHETRLTCRNVQFQHFCLQPHSSRSTNHPGGPQSRQSADDCWRLNPEIAVWYTLKTFHQTLPQVFIAVKRSRIRILNQCCQPRTNVWRIRPDRTFGLVFLSPNHNWKCCHQFRTIDVLHKARKRTHRCNTTLCSRNRSPSSQRQLWIVRLPNTTVCKKVDPITSRSHLRAKTSHQVRNGQQCSLTSDVCE